jgi:hypothetical protein
MGIVDVSYRSCRSASGCRSGPVSPILPSRGRATGVGITPTCSTGHRLRLTPSQPSTHCSRLAWRDPTSASSMRSSFLPGDPRPSGAKAPQGCRDYLRMQAETGGSSTPSMTVHALRSYPDHKIRAPMRLSDW